MSNNMSFILAMSCSVPALFGAIKFKKTDECYKPFLWLMISALIIELIADLPIVVLNNYKPALIAYPLYALVEIYLLLLFFKKNNLVANYKIIWIIFIGAVLIYLISFILKKNISNNITTVCNIFFRVIIIIFSVRMMSNEVFEIKIIASKNPKMIIAFGCIIFYSFDLLWVTFDFMNSNRDLYLHIFLIHQIANVISYSIFTWAIIWIPLKTKY